MEPVGQAERHQEKALIPPIFVLGKRIPYLSVSASVDEALGKLGPLLQGDHPRRIHVDDLDFYDGLGHKLEPVGDFDQPQGLRIETHQDVIRRRIVEQFRWAQPIAQFEAERNPELDYADYEAASAFVEDPRAFEDWGHGLVPMFDRRGGIVWWVLCCLWNCKHCLTIPPQIDSPPLR